MKPPPMRGVAVCRQAPRTSGMIKPTLLFYIVFGILSIAGGLMGFLKAGSKASLIAGGISGVLLIVSAVLLKSNVNAGLILGGLISVALAGRFVPALLKGGAFMPSGLMAILSVISIILTALAFFKK
jgi:uncharacterized membrane protein (UPF0136 family)